MDANSRVTASFRILRDRHEVSTLDGSIQGSRKKVAAFIKRIEGSVGVEMERQSSGDAQIILRYPHRDTAKKYRKEF